MEKSQKNIILITVSVIIIIFTLISYFNWQISEDQKQLIINHKQNSVNILQTSIHERFSSHMALIEEILSHSIVTKFSEVDKINPEFNGVPENIETEQRSELKHLLENNPRFESVGLFLPNGDIYLAEPFSSQLNLPQQNYVFRDWYQGAINNEGVYVSEPYETHYTNEKTIALSASIHDDTENIMGIFHTTLKLDFLQKLIDVQTKDHTSWYFVDGSGKIGLASNSNYDEQFFYGLISNMVDKRGYLHNNFAGEDHLVVYSTVDLGTKEWFLFQIQPSSKAFISIAQAQYLTLSLLVVSVAVIVCFGIIVFWQNKKNLVIQSQLEKSNKKLSSLLVKKREIEKEKDEFSAMITHELKTPLVPIIGHTKMLSKDDMIGKLNKEQLDSVKTIERNAKRLEKLISDIMDARKLDLGKMKFDVDDISLNSFLSSIQSNYQDTMREKEIEFEITIPKNDVHIKTDESRLRQITDNLMNNAIKFVPKNRGKITLGVKKENEFVKFYVQDNGPGIPKDKQENLFQKFYQVDTSHTRKVQGTGLGLVICKGIVEKLGGKIWVESDGKTGTVFHFLLPIQKNT